MSKKENTENSVLRISLCGSHLSDEEEAPKYITKKMNLNIGLNIIMMV